MNDWLTWSAAAGEPAAWWLGATALRATLIFLAAALAVRCMRRTSAAARHFVWMAAFVGAGALPLAMTSLPAWHWNPLADSDPLATWERAQEERLQHMAAVHPATDEAMATASTASLEDAFIVAQTVTTPAPALPAPPIVAPSRPWPWALMFVSVWAIGAGILIVRIVLGSLSLAHLGRTASIATDARLQRLFAQSRQQLNCQRDVRLLISPARHVPMTWGFFRPTVLLPASSRSWSDVQLRMVLMHELAHIVRADCATQWLAQVCRAMYWYNPLSWYALVNLRAEQEQACDDRVLLDGCDASDYAEHLVAVAAGLAPRRWAAAVALAMADRTRMERRVYAILNGALDRRALTVGGAAACLTASAAILLPLASFSTKPLQAAASTKTLAPTAKWVEHVVVRQGDKESTTTTTTTTTTTDDAQNPIVALQEHVKRKYVTAPDEASLVQGAMRGMVEALHDPHSQVMSAADLAQLERHIGGALTGIGAQLEMRDGRAAVLTPLENSPALKAGLRPGDLILAIDGQATGDNLSDVASRIMGPADSTVKLHVRRADGAEETLEIRRASFKVPTVQGYQRSADGAWDFQLDPANKIAYARITQFSAETSQELHDAVIGLNDQIAGLVIDLRDCPGGLMQQAIDVVRLFSPTGDIVTLRGRDGSEQRIGDGNAPMEPVFPIVVLVNEHTASSAEIVAGALQANKVAIVVGTRTHGKASVQELVRLDDGTGIRLTTAFYHLPDGRNIHKRPGEKTWGVDPNEGFFVPMSAKQEEAFRRSVRERERLGGAPVAAEKPSLENPALADRDPQLAAAWRAMKSKLTDGEFKPTGGTAAQLQAFVEQQELAARRGELVTQLESVSRELRELDSTLGSKAP